MIKFNISTFFTLPIWHDDTSVNEFTTYKSQFWQIILNKENYRCFMSSTHTIVITITITKRNLNMDLPWSKHLNHIIIHCCVYTMPLKIKMYYFEQPFAAMIYQQVLVKLHKISLLSSSLFVKTWTKHFMTISRLFFCLTNEPHKTMSSEDRSDT